MPDTNPPPGPADHPCPGPCQNQRPPGKYTCPSCWHQMTFVTRAYLVKRDALAGQRHLELVEQFGRGVSPGDIRVTRDRTATGGPR